MTLFLLSFPLFRQANNLGSNVGGICCPDVWILTVSFMQSLLKKHEALDNDFAVHEAWVQNVCAQGEGILSKVRDSRNSWSNLHFQKGLAQI